MQKTFCEDPNDYMSFPFNNEKLPIHVEPISKIHPMDAATKKPFPPVILCTRPEYLNCVDNKVRRVPIEKIGLQELYPAIMGIWGNSVIIDQYVYWYNFIVFAPEQLNSYIYRLSIVSGQLSKTADLKFPMSCFYCTDVMKKWIYVLGKKPPLNNFGNDPDFIQIDGCQKYNIKNNSWTIAPPLITKVNFESVCLTFSNRFIYVPLSGGSIRGSPDLGPSFARLDILFEENGWEILKCKNPCVGIMSSVSQCGPQEIMILSSRDPFLDKYNPNHKDGDILLTTVNSDTLAKQKQFSFAQVDAAYQYACGPVRIMKGKFVFGLREDYDSGYTQFGAQFMRSNFKNYQCKCLF